MATKTKYGSVKRFGTRYGRNNKEVFGKIEQEQRRLHKCPYCNFVKVKRISPGIWRCRKCNAKFTSKAYTVSKFPDLRRIIVEEEVAVVEAVQ
jgi:large subunit ribosomal protein L37Ae